MDKRDRLIEDIKAGKAKGSLENHDIYGIIIRRTREEAIEYEESQGIFRIKHYEM